MAQASDNIREFTLHHSRPEFRTRWRVPEAYLSLSPDLRQPETNLSRYYDGKRDADPRSIIVIDAALPDMEPWWRSGLDLGNDNDLKRHVSISIRSSYDFVVEKRTIPRLLKKDLEFVQEYKNDFLQYREVRKNERGETILVVPISGFYLMPKEQIFGRFVYFTCERRCTARADFSAAVFMTYSLALESLGEWERIDRKVRDLLTKFYIR